MRLNILQKACLTFMVALTIFWVWLFLTNSKEGLYNYLFSFLFGLTPLIGGAVAMFNSKYWGGLKSSVGKAVFLIGLGVLCWGFGELIWSYYNFFLNQPAPYPSIADLGFAPSIFFYGLGAIYLSKATGARYGFRNKYAKIFTLGVFAVISIVSYYILIIVARGGVLIPEGEPLIKAILDVAYPLGDFLGLTIAILVSGLSFKYFGGKYLLDIFSILAGLAVMFIADSIFSYTTTIGTYFNADLGDYLLALGTFLLTFGVLGFYKIKD